MANLPPEPTSATVPPVTIEQLLLRDDTWLGHSRRFSPRVALETGFAPLNDALLNNGWPLGSLIEVCQRGIQAEWQLFNPALLQQAGLIVLLNPPAVPFSLPYLQMGLDLDRLVVVKADDKTRFVASFIELARAGIGAVLAWQNRMSLTYTELRKCALAASESDSLCVLFRSAESQQQNSPAALRLFVQLVPGGLEITAFKQKGFLLKQQPQPLVLNLPERWRPEPPYYALTQTASDPRTHKPKRLASVTPIRGAK
jgi:protein ImuA